ncbi:MAG: 16S rRNA (adenine(1518)-N(6)/adenine(1519)-N(6))-dimethyltransferase RsmA [Buchnera aphidicola (Schlechtendalia peitan)]
MIKFTYNKHCVKKRLGQNFLINNDVINNIISSISPKSTDVMVEIGPGLGALTDHIYNIVHKLFVIEYDNDLVTKLLIAYSNIKNLEIFFKNVLEFDFFRIGNNYYNSIRVFGNLPYNISVSILLHLFKYNNIVDIHCMFQKEVADRLLACPGTKNYGRLSIISQYYCNITRLFDVYPQSFRPIPKINSTFLRLSPHKKYSCSMKNIKHLIKIVTLAFRNRRKILKNSLSELFNENTLINLKINPMLRAENLSVKQYCYLSNYISSL